MTSSSGTASTLHLAEPYAYARDRGDLPQQLNLFYLSLLPAYKELAIYNQTLD
jgi:hypothetical protein